MVAYDAIWSNCDATGQETIIAEFFIESTARLSSTGELKAECLFIDPKIFWAGKL